MMGRQKEDGMESCTIWRTSCRYLMTVMMMMMMMILSVMLSNLISKLHTKAHSGYLFRLSNRKKIKNKKTLPTPPLLFSQPNLGGSRSQKKKNLIITHLLPPINPLSPILPPNRHRPRPQRTDSDKQRRNRTKPPDPNRLYNRQHNSGTDSTKQITNKIIPRHNFTTPRLHDIQTISIQTRKTK